MSLKELFLKHGQVWVKAGYYPKFKLLHLVGTDFILIETKDGNKIEVLADYPTCRDYELAA